jgi:hypothetical protein
MDNRVCTFDMPTFRGYHISYGSAGAGGSPQELANLFCTKLGFAREEGEYPPGKSGAATGSIHLRTALVDRSPNRDVFGSISCAVK